MKGIGEQRRMESLVERWRRSGAPLTAFARAEGVTRGKLEYWRRRTGTPSRRRARAAESASFVPVHLSPSSANRSVVEVVLPDGIRIGINEGASPELALAIIEALRRTC